MAGRPRPPAVHSRPVAVGDGLLRRTLRTAAHLLRRASGLGPESGKTPCMGLGSSADTQRSAVRELRPWHRARRHPGWPPDPTHGCRHRGHWYRLPPGPPPCPWRHNRDFCHASFYGQDERQSVQDRRTSLGRADQHNREPGPNRVGEHLRAPVLAPCLGGHYPGHPLQHRFRAASVPERASLCAHARWHCGRPRMAAPAISTDRAGTCWCGGRAGDRLGGDLGTADSPSVAADLQFHGGHARQPAGSHPGIG